MGRHEDKHHHRESMGLTGNKREKEDRRSGA